MESCPHCARTWVDGSTDFGGERGRAFVLRPVLGRGIEVRVGGALICCVSRDELQAFLDRVYGPA